MVNQLLGLDTLPVIPKYFYSFRPNESHYTVSIRRRAMKDLENIPADYTQLIAQHINGFGQNPYPPDAKKLKGDSGYSQRVGVYRILYDVDDTARMVTVYRVKHRREAYR